MLKNVELAGAHLAPSRRMVVLEHIGKRLPEQFEIVFGKAGPLGVIGGDVDFGTVEAVGDNMLAAHGAIVAGHNRFV